MWFRRFTDFILRGRLQAIGATLAVSFIPLVGGSISVLIAALVTLRQGVFEGALVLCAAIVPVVISYIAYPEAGQTEALFIATVLVIATDLFTWFFAVLLRRYNYWGVVIETAMLLGVMFIATIHLVYPDVQGWWATQLTAYFNKTASWAGQLAPEGITVMPADAQASLVASMKQYATGFVIASFLFNALLQLLLARGWQAMIFNPGGLRIELRQIRLSYVSAVIGIVVIGLALLSNGLGLDAMPVVVLSFCMAGLSLIHAMLVPYRTAWFWLLLVYVGVFFIFPWCVMIVSIMALLDSLLNIRKRLSLS